MADPHFFLKTHSKTIEDICAIALGSLAPDCHDKNQTIDDVAPLDVAGPSNISFLDNVRYKEKFISSKAGACIVSKAMASFAPKGMTLIISESPYKSYALVAQSFYPDLFPPSEISPHAHIHPSAKIGNGCFVGAGVVIEANVVIGDGCWIEPNVVIGRSVQLGQKCRVGANASISHAIIGMGTRIYPGARIGQDGFGFAIDPKGHVKVPQLGRVMIGDNVEIGANSCIDRGAGPDTVIGSGTWIDNLVQIGHNVKIGRGCVLVSQSGVAGSTVLDDYAVLAAQAGVAGHLHIGMGAQIGAKAGVMRDVPAGEQQLGAPSMPIREFMKQVATLKRLTKDRKSE